MGIVFSNILNYDTPEDTQIEEKINKCNNIISTLNRIESRLENTEKILQEIEEAIKNENPFEQHHTMEWDYYDLDHMETKKLK
tara:strand:+ start:376 stop:624 length:249 start_codon:yes stop_codon:yes gene_type:complete